MLDWGTPGDAWQPPPGQRLTLKLEQLQLTGSFKVRGVLNLLADLPETERARGLVTASGRPLTLSMREYELLLALARRSGRIIPREDVYLEVWRSPMRKGDRSVDVYVHKLRAKLERALPERRYIHTHVGFGYRLDGAPSHPFHTAATTE